MFNAEREELSVTVVDSGIGMSEEEVSKSTNMLGYLVRTAESNACGIGLGLTVSN